MPTSVSEELASFHRFLSQQLQNGGPGMSPEEALDLWRAEHPSREDYEETVRALREALADIEAGDKGIPFEQFDAEMRRKHGLGSP
jgi:hypothetical protein